MFSFLILLVLGMCGPVVCGFVLFLLCIFGVLFVRYGKPFLRTFGFLILGGLSLIGILFVRYGGLFNGDHEQPYDRIFYSIALDFKTPDICKKIDINSSQAETDPPAFDGYVFFQADCYYASAVKLHDADLCKFVKIPLQAWGTEKFYDYSYNACLQAVEKQPRDMRLETNLDYDKLVPFFHALGYTSDNTDFAKKYWQQFHNENDFFVHFYEYMYGLLYVPPSEIQDTVLRKNYREDFLNRVRNYNDNVLIK